MTFWIFRRVLKAFGVMAIMTLIAFIGLHAIGDPVEILISPDASFEDRARMIKDLGLDRPLYEQHFQFVSSLLHGNLGTSYVFNEPATQLILTRLPATIELAFSAVLLSILIGLSLGLLTGSRPGSLISGIIMRSSILGFSLPLFWVILIFSVHLDWLPSTTAHKRRRFLVSSGLF